MKTLAFSVLNISKRVNFLTTQDDSTSGKGDSKGYDVEMCCIFRQWNQLQTTLRRMHLRYKAEGQSTQLQNEDFDFQTF